MNTVSAHALPGRPALRGARPSHGLTTKTCKSVLPSVFWKPVVRGNVQLHAHARHPPKEGLIKDAEDKDACGVGFVGELTKVPSRKCITDALGMLVRMTHRGACGCEENTGAGPAGELPEPDGSTPTLARNRLSTT